MAGSAFGRRQQRIGNMWLMIGRSRSSEEAGARLRLDVSSGPL